MSAFAPSLVNLLWFFIITVVITIWVLFLDNQFYSVIEPIMRKIICKLEDNDKVWKIIDKGGGHKRCKEELHPGRVIPAMGGGEKGSKISDGGGSGPGGSEGENTFLSGGDPKDPGKQKTLLDNKYVIKLITVVHSNWKNISQFIFLFLGLILWAPWFMILNSSG